MKISLKQTIKTTLLILFFAGICLPMSVQAQSDKTKIGYSKKSNILNPDTLQGDQKKIFWHPYFINLSSKEVETIDPFKVKGEFKKLGITLLEDKRFGDACIFFTSTMKNHKKSVENWDQIKYLIEPPKK